MDKLKAESIVANIMIAKDLNEVKEAVELILKEGDYLYKEQASAIVAAKMILDLKYICSKKDKDCDYLTTILLSMFLDNLEELEEEYGDMDDEKSEILLIKTLSEYTEILSYNVISKLSKIVIEKEKKGEFKNG